MQCLAGQRTLMHATMSRVLTGRGAMHACASSRSALGSVLAAKQQCRQRLLLVSCRAVLKDDTRSKQPARPSQHGE